MLKQVWDDGVFIIPVTNTIIMAGYSSTPLAKKLGLKPGFNISLINAPEHYFELFTDMPAGITFADNDKILKGILSICLRS